MKNSVKTYHWRCLILLLSGIFLLFSCSETQQQTRVRKKPKIIRNKIIFAGQSQPTPVIHAEASTITVTVKKKPSDSHQYTKTIAIKSTAAVQLMSSTVNEPVALSTTSESLTSSTAQNQQNSTELKASVQQTDNVKTAESVPAKITADSDMAVMLKKLAPKPFRYRPQGKVDPFIPLIVKKKRTIADSQPAAKIVTQKRTRILTLLEKFDLSQLKLTAIMMAPKHSFAIVEESSGRGFVVKIGTRIGLNSGRVVDILLDRIIIQEIEEIIAGKRLYITKEMKLNKPDSEF